MPFDLPDYGQAMDRLFSGFGRHTSAFGDLLQLRAIGEAEVS